jgi:hypothetical protein
VRQAIDPALRRLAASSPDFCQTLLQPLLDCLFRAETAPGLHADVTQWLLQPLRGALDASGSATVLRLSSARSKGAQELAAQLLESYGVHDFSLADWVAFGRNDMASVRSFAAQAFRQNVAIVRADMPCALRLLDSRWDDSLAFACDFFRKQCQASDWNPALLVSLCDHLNPLVQRFGREMLQTHFELADVSDYLLKLSQHPSNGMQLFVSGWLESAAAADSACLLKLEAYFLTVLSQINRGRVVKQRVFAFLRTQALQSEVAAQMVLRLYQRLLPSMAIGDKAQYIETLRVIAQHYPHLPPVLQALPIPAAAVRHSVASGGRVQ